MTDSHYHSAIAIAYGLTLALFGFVQMCLGEALFEALRFTYGFLFGYVPMLIAFVFINGRQSDIQLPTNAWSYLSVVISVAFGYIAHGNQEAGQVCAMGLSGMTIYLLDLLLFRRAMKVYMLMISTLLPAFFGVIATKTFISLATVINGFFFFVNGCSILLGQPLHDVIIKKLVGQEAILSGTMHLIFQDAAVLAVMCILFQIFGLRQRSK